MVDKVFNPDMLYLARQARGPKSLRALGEEVGVSEGQIHKWENGVQVPSEERVVALSRALRYPPTLFFRPETVRGSDSICLHHRKRKSMPATQISRIEGEMHLAQLQIKRLLTDLAIDSPFNLMTLDPEDHGGPAGTADALRSFWRLPVGPIPNVTRMIESAGAVIMQVDFLTNKLDGMSCWARSTPPLFFINSRLTTDRMRWTVVHELAHLVMHHSPPEGDAEVEADDFTREMLLPKSKVMHDLRTLSFRSLPALKQIWRVPMKELITAASRYEALPPAKVKSLAVQYSRAGWHNAEPYELSPEQPMLIESANQVHLGEHGYTISELAQVADLEPDEFQSLYSIQAENPPGRHLRSI